MKQLLSRWWMPPWHAALGVMVAVLVACGGGGGVGEGGTGSFVSGPISGFGSVIVRDARFELDASTVVTDDDGKAFDDRSLRLGMTVDIDGSALPAQSDSDGFRTATAHRIQVGSELVGPVGFDTSGGFLVLGITVDTTTAVVDDATLPNGLAGLATGDIAEVYGFHDAPANRFVATRIERKSATPPAFKIRGIVGSVSGSVIGIAGQSFQLPPGAPTAAVGQLVRLKLNITPVAGVWIAEQAEDSQPRISEGTGAKVEGVVTSFESPQHFLVDGVEVTTTASTAIENGLGLGARVEVEGTVVNGVIVARQVEVETEDEVESREQELRGHIATVDQNSQTFVLLGQTVDYASVMQYEPSDRSASDLRADVAVEVKGVMSADRTRLVAREIKFP
jgi:hypothetical protein